TRNHTTHHIPTARTHTHKESHYTPYTHSTHIRGVIQHTIYLQRTHTHTHTHTNTHTHAQTHTHTHTPSTLAYGYSVPLCQGDLEHLDSFITCEHLMYSGIRYGQIHSRNVL